MKVKPQSDEDELASDSEENEDRAMNEQMSNGSDNQVDQSGKTMMDKRQRAKRAQMRNNQIKSSLTVGNRLKQ